MAKESGNNLDTCRLQAPERNRYFFGKLMTVRDFEVEQSYHREAVRTIHRLVHGVGIACGLEVGDPKVRDEELQVELGEGLGCDCCGNRIVVPRKGRYPVKGDIRPGDSAYLYLRYDQFGRETAPRLPNSCPEGEQCVNSRIRESFRLEISYDDPPPDPPEPFARGDLDLSSAESLHRWAGKYAGENLGECPRCRDPRVFLAVIAFSRRGTPQVDEAATRSRRQVIYNNPMLRDLFFGHVADRNNPHEVDARQTGALTEVNGVSNPGGGVELRSSDRSISIKPDRRSNAIDLRALVNGSPGPGPRPGPGGVFWGELWIKFDGKGRSIPQVVTIGELERGQQFSVILASRLAPGAKPPVLRGEQGNFFIYGDQGRNDRIFNQESHALIAYVPVFPNPDKAGALEPNRQFVVSGNTAQGELKNNRMRVFFWVITGERVDTSQESYEDAQARWERERQEAEKKIKEESARDPDLEDRIIDYLKEHPVTPPKTIADSLGDVDKDAVNASLQALEKDGIVVKNAQGRYSIAA